MEFTALSPVSTYEDDFDYGIPMHIPWDCSDEGDNDDDNDQTEAFLEDDYHHQHQHHNDQHNEPMHIVIIEIVQATCIIRI